SLSLSTARPSLAAVLPELDPWYLNVYMPPVRPLVDAPAPHILTAASPPTRRSAAVQMPPHPQALAMPTMGGMEDSYLEAEEVVASLPVSADIATAVVERTGTALVFRAGRSVDIPSDNSPHKTTIARDSLPCAFDYVSAPVIEEAVHVRASIVNTTE